MSTKEDSNKTTIPVESNTTEAPVLETPTTNTARRGVLIPELRNTLRRFERVYEPRSHAHKSEISIDMIMSNEAATREVLSTIAVVAFVGPSGTGKSTRAIRVAKTNNISYLIDDGLLINGSRIVAGISAKKAPTKMESVRQALFADPTRSAVMRKALVENHPTVLMILGTSDSMLSKICNNLWLNPPAMLIRIEDVSTEEEMRQARNTRMTEGTHTIPVPSMEIKHEFSGYFADPLNMLRQRFDRDRGVSPVVPDVERTMVRPTFSTLGSYSISDDALLDLIKIELNKVPGYAEVVQFKSEKRTYGVVINIDLGIYYGADAQEVLLNAQQSIGKSIEEFTSITMIAVNVRARRVVHIDKKL